MSAEVERAMISNVAAWWDTKKEHVTDHLMNLEEAWETGVLDWDVDLVPIEFNGIETGYNLLVRSTDDKVLNCVGSDFTPMQNRQLADTLNAICNEGDLGVESILSLKGGKVVAICARFPESMRIAGEEHVQYVTAANWHGPTQAKFYTSDVRTVCRNTLNAGLFSATNVYRIRHVGNMEAKIREAREVLGMACKWTAELKEIGEDLAAQRIGGRELDGFLKKLVPDVNGKEAEAKMPAVIKTREGIREVYTDTPDLENIRGTKWGVLQAVIAHQDHRRNYRTPDNRFVDILHANNLNERALKMLVKA
jgi:phage/plasmid-like protein (TIGR03299 family)